MAAVLTAWWVDRSNSRRELQRVQLNLALEEDFNKNLTFKAKVLADSDARRDAIVKEHFKRAAIDRAAIEENFKRAIEAARALGPPPLPTSSAPAPNPPKK